MGMVILKERPTVQHMYRFVRGCSAEQTWQYVLECYSMNVSV